jgi:hypothetical protein
MINHVDQDPPDPPHHRLSQATRFVRFRPPGLWVAPFTVGSQVFVRYLTIVIGVNGFGYIPGMHSPNFPGGHIHKVHIDIWGGLGENLAHYVLQGIPDRPLCLEHTPGI